MTYILIMIVVGLMLTCISLTFLYLDAVNRANLTSQGARNELELRTNELIIELEDKYSKLLANMENRGQEMMRAQVASAKQLVQRMPDIQEHLPDNASFTERHSEILQLLRDGHSIDHIVRKTGYSADKIRLIKGFGEIQHEER